MTGEQDTTKDRIKRWGKGLLILVAAWLGTSEFPLGQYDAKPADPEVTDEQDRPG